ncbi:MAG TPA: receptor ligand binding family protein [Cyanobacteria bacterium UBA11691]|nr:receptor ligand binding family protein [Cyanobacteria bacterium UBA11691]
MAQKNDTPILVVALIVCLGVVGLGLWWFLNRTEVEIASSPSPEMVDFQVEERLSSGERLLITQGATLQKRSAVAQIAQGNWEEAIANLEDSLNINRNDPEALIYLNNARIAGQTAYTLAVSVPITTQLNAAQELLRGVAQAQQEMNEQGGIQGTPLQILIADDANNPDAAVEIAQKLVADDRILAVIGHYSSGVSLAAASVYENGQLVMISPTSTSVELSGRGNYIFRTVPSDRFSGTTLARYLLQDLQKQKVAVFFNSTSNYSQSLKDSFTTALFADGGEVVTEIDFASFMFNPSQAIEEVMAQGAEAILLASDSTVFPDALDAIIINNHKLPLLGGDSLYRSEVLKAGRAKAMGMVVAIPWDFVANANSAFAQSSLQLWSAQVNWRTALAYDAAQALLEALTGEEPSRSSIQKALVAPDFQVSGASGTIRFLPSGDRNQALQLVQVQPGDLTGFGYDFVPLVGFKPEQ